MDKLSKLFQQSAEFKQLSKCAIDTDIAATGIKSVTKLEQLSSWKIHNEDPELMAVLDKKEEKKNNVPLVPVVGVSDE